MDEEAVHPVDEHDAADNDPFTWTNWDKFFVLDFAFDEDEDSDSSSAESVEGSVEAEGGVIGQTLRRRVRSENADEGSV